MKDHTHEEHHKHYRHMVKSLEARALRKRPWSLKFADELTSFFGSMPFLVLNGAIFFMWIVLNSSKVLGQDAFDRFPYPMLTTVVSLEAIILTTIVLMSQNRQSLMSSLREEMDIQVNLISEREITKILVLLDKLLKDRGIKLEDRELDDMLKELNQSYIERKLEQQIIERNGKPKSENEENMRG